MDRRATAVVLFDGVCNLCNGAVQFIIDRDPEGRFHFASLQSEVGRELLTKLSLPPIDSMVLIEDEEAYMRSTATLRIARKLRGPWPALYALVLVPRFIRDALYDFVARHRYGWFGKTETCRLPTPELEARFIQDERRISTC